MIAIVCCVYDHESDLYHVSVVIIFCIVFSYSYQNRYCICWCYLFDKGL